VADERSGSILAVDFGNIQTRAILIDLVDGIYRLVARGETRTTVGFPANDARVGLQRAVEQITAVTGRKLLLDDGRILSPEQQDRSGVDHFITTASIGRTLRTIVVGLVPDVSLASAHRALAGTYVEIVGTLSLEDSRSEEDQVNAIVSSRPDLIFITGGMEGGAEKPVLDLAHVVRTALRLVRGGRKPIVLYAGNSALVSNIRDLFDGLATIFIAPNIRPSLDEEELESAQLQLALAFNERLTNHSGVGQLGRMSRLSVLPTAQSYSIITEYLGQMSGKGVLAVDIGSAVGVMSAYVDGHVSTTIRTDIGLGHSADLLLGAAGEALIKQWLPFATTPNQIRHYVLNKTLVPGSIPETLKGLYLEYALLRGGIGELLKASRPMWKRQVHFNESELMPPLELVIGAGAGLTRSGTPGLSALLLLDAIQPTGVTRLQTDPYGVIAALGALALITPEAVVQVLDSSGLERLGTAFSVSGEPSANRPAMRVRIKTSDGQVIKHHVQGGHIWVYPLGVGKTASVEVSAGRGLQIGGRGKVKLTAEGGSVGLIFDARGRALPLAADVRIRAGQIPMWISEITGDPLLPIDESWLVSPVDDVAVVEQTAEPSASGKRGRARRRRDKKRSTGEADVIKLRPDLRLHSTVKDDDDDDDDLNALRRR